MRIDRIEEMKGGWFIGNFEPNLRLVIKFILQEINGMLTTIKKQKRLLFSLGEK
jgi:hypothetical protein